MKSKLFEALLRLEALGDEESNGRPLEVNSIVPVLSDLQDIERPFYDKVSLDMGELVKHGQVIGRLAATNILASDSNNVMMAIQLGSLLNNELVVILLAYAAKHAILLNLAEAEAKASEAQMLPWTLAPQQESQPNQDPPVEQPDELP